MASDYPLGTYTLRRREGIARGIDCAPGRNLTGKRGKRRIETRFHDRRGEGDSTAMNRGPWRRNDGDGKSLDRLGYPL